MPVQLTVVAGPQAGQEFRFDDRDTFLAGRAPDCHFRPAYDDPYISPHHFLLLVGAPRCRVIDLNSRTGTKVGGRKVEAAELSHGDEVRAGQTVFQLSVVAAPAPPRPAARVP